MGIETVLAAGALGMSMVGTVARGVAQKNQADAQA